MRLMREIAEERAHTFLSVGRTNLLEREEPPEGILGRGELSTTYIVYTLGGRSGKTPFASLTSGYAYCFNTHRFAVFVVHVQRIFPIPARPDMLTSTVECTYQPSRCTRKITIGTPP